jgi:hypothetical protein
MKDRSSIFAEFDIAMLQLRVINPAVQLMMRYTMDTYRQIRESQIKQADAERNAFMQREHFSVLTNQTK